jgi:hypothetical protein
MIMKLTPMLILVLISFYSARNESKKIWDKAPHSAFTSLIYYNDYFYCCFREAKTHVDRDEPDNGIIRILYSKNARQWKEHSTVKIDGFDLRDPQLSQTYDGKLMLLMGKCSYKAGATTSTVSVVSFLELSDKNFSPPTPIKLDIAENKFSWLWKVEWHNNIAYGVIRIHPEGIYFVRSNDGINYHLIKKIPVDDGNECAISFTEEDNMTMIIRRDGMNAYLAESKYPFSEIELTELNIEVGGPELIILPNNQILFASRNYVGKVQTSIYALKEKKLIKILTLPSGGDCSYPGMVLRNRKLYISYYSSHYTKASIYLSIIPVNNITKTISSL